LNLSYFTRVLGFHSSTSFIGGEGVGVQAK